MEWLLGWLGSDVYNTRLSCDGFVSADPVGPGLPEQNQGSKGVRCLFCSYLPWFWPSKILLVRELEAALMTIILVPEVSPCGQP